MRSFFEIGLDETTDMTTSHLTNPAKDAGQVIGYSHSIDGTSSHSTGGTTSQSTKPSKNDGKVAGYKRANNTRQVAGYKRDKTCAKWLVMCALAIAFSTSASAEKLGRLFFTPEQRNQLDYNYAQDSPSGNYNNALILNGIVQKRGGKRTAWINGVPQAVGRSDERSPESVMVPLPGQKKSVKLKVGQRVLLNPATGTDATATQDQGQPQQ